MSKSSKAARTTTAKSPRKGRAKPKSPSDTAPSETAGVPKHAADALARYDAKAEADHAALLVHPEVRAMADESDRWNDARREAGTVIAWFQEEIRKLNALHPNGYAAGSATDRQYKRLIEAMNDAESSAYERHGFTVTADVAAEPIDATGESIEDDTGEYMPAAWFSTHDTDRKVPATRLRKAAAPGRKSKRLRAKTIDGEVRYSVTDARRLWPLDMMRDAPRP